MQDRDYATLEKSIRSPPGPTVPGIHSTPHGAYHGAGSLPRRYSSGGGHVDHYDGGGMTPSRSAGYWLNFLKVCFL